MPKIKLALYSSDEIYCERFAAYMAKHRSMEVDLAIFSDLEKLKSSKKIYDCMIISEEAAEHFKDQKILILSEELQENVAEEPALENEKMSGKIIVSKYQPMEQLLHTVFVQAGYRKRTGKLTQTGRKIKIAGVCSPARHEMQVFYSILFAENVAKEKQILYMNLMEFVNFRELFGCNGEMDMGDFLLEIKNQRLTPERFSQFIYRLGGTDVILPFANPENIGQMGEAEIAMIIDFIERYTEYNMLVIDFGFGLRELSKCLNLCDVLYVVGRGEYFYQSFEEKFFIWLKKTLQEDLLKKIRKIEIPYTAKDVRNDGNILEQLQWSNFGDYVRQCTQREMV